eukprot:scaffold18813_cov55-Phaeocystis_antarctica.AAC.3
MTLDRARMQEEGARPHGRHKHQVGGGEQRREDAEADEVRHDADGGGEERHAVGQCRHDNRADGTAVGPAHAAQRGGALLGRRGPRGLSEGVRQHEYVVAPYPEDHVEAEDVEHTE